MELPPWAPIFLKPIQEEYQRVPPEHRTEPATESDIKYIRSLVQLNDPFDTLGLKYEMVSALHEDRAFIKKSVVPGLGEIIVILFKGDTWCPPWRTWWRAVRLLVNPVRIVIFAHPLKREAPEIHKPIAQEHVNGGTALRCMPTSIVIYRKEECTRVLLHELFHATCTDPYSKTTPEIEADTEAWAELVLCAMTAKGIEDEWLRLLHQQFSWAVEQANYVRKKYGVVGPDQYGWRYLVGRIHVWEVLGFTMPHVLINKKKRQTRSLRFTICEPNND
jgi:hypothetical protein